MSFSLDLFLSLTKMLAINSALKYSKLDQRNGLERNDDENKDFVYRIKRKNKSLINRLTIHLSICRLLDIRTVPSDVNVNGVWSMLKFSTGFIVHTTKMMLKYIGYSLKRKTHIEEILVDALSFAHVFIGAWPQIDHIHFQNEAKLSPKKNSKQSFNAKYMAWRTKGTQRERLAVKKSHF